MNIKPIKRVAMSDMSVERIKEYLESGELAIGDKLPTEKEFCEMLGVSRSTVREAIRILQATGYVEMRPGLGAFLLRNKPVDPEKEIVEWFIDHEIEVEDYVEVRMVVEPLAAKLAVKRATKEDLERIEECRIAYENALEKGETEKLGDCDAAFHAAIVEASHNYLLTKFNMLIQATLKDFRKTTFQVQKNAINAIAPHRRINKAIIEKDPQLAQDAMLAHLKRVVEDMEALVQYKDS